MTTRKKKKCGVIEHGGHAGPTSWLPLQGAGPLKEGLDSGLATRLATNQAILAPPLRRCSHQAAHSSRHDLKCCTKYRISCRVDTLVCFEERMRMCRVIAGGFLHGDLCAIV